MKLQWLILGLIVLSGLVSTTMDESFFLPIFWIAIAIGLVVIYGSPFIILYLCFRAYRFHKRNQLLPLDQRTSFKKVVFQAVRKVLFYKNNYVSMKWLWAIALLFLIFFIVVVFNMRVTSF